MPDFTATRIAITVTAIFVIGLERRDRTVFRIGYDAFAVLAVNPSGLVLLYFLRDVNSGGG
ncbi:hypothetical protein PZN02_005022 [Sinorhizobium garamanticum]|uniref:Uncharacterized protein n=1 Tax=Sinorhizobium garamanticum TaxID=680247 RepID=A0ABY8DLB0_9HYPH|nr:hypothetical protein [Sinorhizobium garamanticum]WEX89711.1 hypothetical protein PZN02_005022 [Sinorhizobium garamanticum]